MVVWQFIFMADKEGYTFELVRVNEDQLLLNSQQKMGRQIVDHHLELMHWI